jgi:hypothetical protein
MTQLELVQIMVTAADEGLEPLKAFANATKAGMTNIKRDAFEAEYASFVASPFMRRLRAREAREKDFVMRLGEACFLVDPPEVEVMALAAALSRAKSEPGAVPNCIELFRPYLAEGKADELMAAYKELY